MTTGEFITQLTAQISKLESLVRSLQNSSFHPSNDQYQILEELGLGFSAAAAMLPAEIAALKERRKGPSCAQGEQLVSQAELSYKDLIATTKLKSQKIFAKSIILFFKGQSDSIVDSTTIKKRKQGTRGRCERICTLSPDGLISWAVAFKPTTWEANLMSKDIFDYVLDHIEPDNCRLWPPVIYKILSGLGDEEPLKDSHKYQAFLKAVEKSKETAQGLDRPGKRRRGSDGAILEDEPLSPVQGSQLVAENKVVPSSVEESDVTPKAVVTRPPNQQSLDKAATSGTETELDSVPVSRKVMKLIKFDKYLLCQILSNLRLDGASTDPTDSIGSIWFAALGNHQIVSLKLSSKWESIVKSHGQVVDVYDDTPGTSKSVAPACTFELEPFMQLLHRDGFGDILWNETGDGGFVTIYVRDPELVADFRQSGTTFVV